MRHLAWQGFDHGPQVSLWIRKGDLPCDESRRPAGTHHSGRSGLGTFPMNNPETVTCLFCAETIPQKSKPCPRCRQWLTRRSFRPPVVHRRDLVFSATMIWVIFAAVMISKLERLQSPRPCYGGFPHAVKIVESRMNWAPTPNGLCIYLTGMPTDASPVRWKDAGFDCRFFDANNLMVDAGTGHNCITIPPEDEAAFRVASTPTAPRMTMRRSRVLSAMPGTPSVGFNLTDENRLNYELI